MDKIRWCLEQKRGIELIEPNDNLGKAYYSEAKDTLENIDLNKDSKWNAIMAYYACYNALYSILMKTGIKSEIHDCTIELMNVIIGFSEHDYSLMQMLKKKRSDNQYYLKHEKLDDLLPIKKFILKCSKIKENLDIDGLRRKIDVIKN